MSLFLVYHGANIDLHRRVNLDVRDKSVEVILERLFKGTDVEYIINNRQIIVRRNEKKENSSLSIQQAKKIHGHWYCERYSWGTSHWCKCTGEGGLERVRLRIWTDIFY